MPFGVYDQGASDRGLSSALWLGCNADVIRNDPRHGVFFLEDFQTLNGSDNYTLTQATTGTFALDTAIDGVGLLDCNSTTAGQGGNLQWQGPSVIPVVGQKTAFECRLKGVDIATGPEIFAGLSMVEDTILASGAIFATDYVGFYGVNATDKVLVAATEDSGTQTVASSSAHTLVEDTYVKLGVVCDGVDDARFYVDGALVSTTTTMDIPEGVALVPSFVCQSDGTTDPIVHIDWFAVGTWT